MAIRRVVFVAVVGLAVFALLMLVASSAQTIPTSVTVLVLPASGDPATVAPLNERTTPLGTAGPDGGIVPTSACGHQPSSGAPSTVVNGSGVEFSDPFDATKVCQAPLPKPLPDGAGYRVAIVLTAPACAPEGQTISPCPSPRSMVSSSVLDVRTLKPRPVLPAKIVVLP
jgi:hypothetical protein